MLLHKSWNVCNRLFDRFFPKNESRLFSEGLRHVEKNAPNLLCSLHSRASPKKQGEATMCHRSAEGSQVLIPTKHSTRWLHWLVPAVGFKQHKSVKSPGLVIQRGECEYLLASVARVCFPHQDSGMFRPAGFVLWECLTSSGCLRKHFFWMYFAVLWWHCHCGMWEHHNWTV